MTPRRGSCPLLLLFSLLCLLLTCAVTCAQEPDPAGWNTTAAAEKAGTCPQAEPETPEGNCTEACRSDASCEGNQKCCQTGCGTSCQIPDGKPGNCPNVDMPIPPLGLCKTMCQMDSNCAGEMKCCKNGCGHMTCSKPVS